MGSACLHLANLLQAVLPALMLLAHQIPGWLHAGLPSPQAAEGIAGGTVPAPVVHGTGRAAGKEEAT